MERPGASRSGDGKVKDPGGASRWAPSLLRGCLYTIEKLYRLALLSWKRMRIAREEGRALRVFQWTG